MKTLLLTTSFFFLFIGLAFSQTGINSSSNSKGHKEPSELSTAKSGEANGADESFSDGYMGYKDQILLRLIAKEIPQNFPKPKLGQARDEYKKTMLEWFEENLDMVKEEYHSNFK